MEFENPWTSCTSLACSDFTEFWLPLAAVYGLCLGIGLVRMAARRRARPLLSLPRARRR